MFKFTQYVVFWLASSIFFECGGDVFSKLASKGDWRWWIVSIISYNLMLLSWFLAVDRAKNITITGMVWLLAGQIGLIIIGVGAFGEVLIVYQKVGCMLAVISMFLMCL